MRTRLLISLVVMAFGFGSVFAHAFLVLGTLTSDPANPAAGEPFTVTLELNDPTETPVEDARVRAEFRPVASDETTSIVASARFEEVAPGVYRARLALPGEGEYRLRLRDQTYREEARATLSFGVGANTNPERFAFVFPPTSTGGNLGIWLLLVTGLPVLAGLLVTVLILTGRAGGENAKGA